MGQATIEPIPREAKGWPREDDVPFLYGTTRALVASLVRRKRLIRYSSPDGARYVDPAACERWIGPPKRSLEGDALAPSLDDQLDRPVQGLTRENVLEMMWRETATLLRDVREQARADSVERREERKELFDLVLSPAKELWQAQRQHVEQLRAENAELRKSEYATRRQHQRLLDEQSARDLALLKETKREERRDRAAKELTPHVVSILGKLGIDVDSSGASAQLAEVRNLIGQFDAELIDILLADPNVTDAQRALIRSLRPKTAPTENGASK